MAPSVLPKRDAAPVPPAKHLSSLHTPPSPAAGDQVQAGGEHCEVPSASLCCVCPPASPLSDTYCLFCSAPYCPLLPSQLFAFSAHTDFISQLSLRLSCALKESSAPKQEEEELQQKEEEPKDRPEKTELNEHSQESRDGYFEMGLDDSLEESSSSSSLPVLTPSLPVEEEAVVQQGALCEQVCRALWCCCLQVNGDAEEIRLNEACLVLTERLLGLLFLSHDFFSTNQYTDHDPSASLQLLLSSLQNHLLLPFTDLQLHSDLDLPDSCLCFSSSSSSTRWFVFSEADELRQTRSELTALLQLEPGPGPLCLPQSLLNSWELEETVGAEWGYPAMLFLSSSSSEDLHPLLQDLFDPRPGPGLPRLLFLTHRQLYVTVLNFRDRTGPGLGQSSQPGSRLVRFPLGSVVVHSKEFNKRCIQHRLRWTHSVELLVLGQKLVLFFPVAQDRASFLEKLSLRRASLEGVRMVPLPRIRTHRDHQGRPRAPEQCCCSRRPPSSSMSSSSVEMEDTQPSPHLVPGLSPGLRLLSGLHPQQLQTLFHRHIALTDGEELKQVLWLSVVLYKSPEAELTCCLLLSTNAIYFLLQDSTSSLSRHSVLDETDSGDPEVCLCCCLSIPLSQLQSVNVGLFDQYFRVVGCSAEQVVCCLSRDSYGTGLFLQELMCALSLQQKAPPPEPSEQDFYSQFHCSGKMQNYELVHSSRVKFIYPSEEEMGDLTFIVSERKTTCSSSLHSFNILLYLLVFQVQVSPQSPAPSGPVLQPRTLILTSTDLFLLDEDYVSYPLPDFAKEPPSKERYQLREARRIRDLDRVLLGYQTYPQALTLVFDELPGPDLLCPLSLNHFSTLAPPTGDTEGGVTASGGVSRATGGGDCEVQWCVFVPGADSRERLISLLARQWEALCSRELPVELTG